MDFESKMPESRNFVNLVDGMVGCIVGFSELTALRPCIYTRLTEPHEPFFRPQKDPVSIKCQPDANLSRANVLSLVAIFIHVSI